MDSRSMSNEEVKTLLDDAHDFITNTGIEYVCDTCQKVLFQRRWKCRTCPSFDECDECHVDALKNHMSEMYFKDKTRHDVVVMDFCKDKRRWFTQHGISSEITGKRKRGRAPSPPPEEKEVLIKDRDEEHRLLLESHARDIEERNQLIILLQSRIKKLRKIINSYEPNQKNDDQKDLEILALRAENKLLKEQAEYYKPRVAIVRGYTLVQIEKKD